MEANCRLRDDRYLYSLHSLAIAPPFLSYQTKPFRLLLASSVALESRKPRVVALVASSRRMGFIFAKHAQQRHHVLREAGNAADNGNRNVRAPFVIGLCDPMTGGEVRIL